MSDESAVLFRIAGFGLVAAVVYWFISYEWLGTVGLLTLAIGPGFAALNMFLAHRRRGLPPEPRAATIRRLIGIPPADPPGPKEYADEDLGILPLPTIWPLAASLGLAILLTGLVFGAWLTILGAALAAFAGWGWLAAINRETTYGRRRGEE